MIDRVVDKDFQRQCKHCFFADTMKVGTGEPCCTYPGKLIIDPETGVCGSKKDQESN